MSPVLAVAVGGGVVGLVCVILSLVAIASERKRLAEDRRHRERAWQITERLAIAAQQVAQAMVETARRR